MITRIFYRVEKPIGMDQVPNNAIHCALHGDVYLMGVGMSQLKDALQGGVYVGNHTFFSYLWSTGPRVRGMRSFRYVRTPGKKVIDSMVEYMNANPRGGFFIRTDGGGPYGKVRMSVVELALRTSRPIVLVRQIASRAWIIRSHQIPKPFCKIKSIFSVPISHEDLQKLSPEKALEFVQNQMDQIR